MIVRLMDVGRMSIVVVEIKEVEALRTSKKK